MRTGRVSLVFHLHLFLLLLLFHLGAAEGGAGHRRSGRWKQTKEFPRIIGGTDASPGEFPHQVSVQHKGFLGSRHVCGGTIMNDLYILTAASCIHAFTVKTLSVVAGVTSLDEDTAQVVKVRSLIIHEDFNAETHSNDIALLKLEEALALDGSVQPLALPPEGEAVPADTLCAVIGWGAIIESGDFHKRLQKAEMTTLSDNECRVSYGAMAIRDSMLCAGLPREEADTCDGDEGGPLLCMGRLHGITSWGKGCAQPYYPRVFSEVAYYRNWIMMYISGP